MSTVFNYEKNELESLKQYDRLEESFHPNEYDQISTYPEYFGGCYVNPDGKLVVYLKEDYADQKKYVNDVVQSEDIITAPAKYSFCEIKRVMNEIDQYTMNEKKKASVPNFKMWCVKDDINRVVVWLNEYSIDNILAFRKTVCDSDAIEFRQLANNLEGEDANINAGAGINNGSSLAYRAKSGSTIGVVTCAHSNPLGSYLTFGGTTFAQVKKTQQHSKLDACWSQIINANYTVTNTIGTTGKTLSGTTGLAPVGSLTYKFGISTGQTSGVTQSNSISFTQGGIYFYDFGAALYHRAPGDSGGVVYRSDNITSGVHHGYVINYAMFTKAVNVASTLGVTRY